MSLSHADEAADRIAIHDLLIAYGSTIDSRDFEGFGRLFDDDATYVAGGGKIVRGGEIAPLLKHIFETGPNATREPNFHLFFNERIWFDSPTRAFSTSMSLFMIPNENKRPMAALAGSYEDELVKKDGRWLFRKRVVKLVENRPG